MYRPKMLFDDVLSFLDNKRFLLVTRRSNTARNGCYKVENTAQHRPLNLPQPISTVPRPLKIQLLSRSSIHRKTFFHRFCLLSYL